MIDSETMIASGLLKLTLAKDVLTEKLALVARGVSTRTAVLVLGGIRVRAQDGQVELAATDMEVSLRSTVDAEIEGEGEVVVPGRLLLDLVRALPDETVTIEHRRPAGELVEAARDVDVLVVGSRGLHGARALGSVSEQVAHEASCSVLVVRGDAG